ncbi:GntR family transcriptional regulator [Nesterenkonia halophila]
MDGDSGPVVQPTLVADQVYAALEGWIMDGTLPAGEPLRIQKISEMVGTSVMPVREAIRRLTEAGLASTQPHKGAVVRTFTIAELINIYDVRTLLEVDAAEKGAPHLSGRSIEQMEDSCRRMFEAVDEGRVSDALNCDEEIIGTVYDAAGNGVLMSMIENLWTQCRPYKVMGAQEAIDQGDGSLWEPQPALIEAVKHGDAERARSITERSLLSARRRLERRLE